MRKSALIGKDFENLLGWLSSDREQAGKIYEEIREGLIRYFRFRGCPEADVLADETLNRVAGKVSDLTKNENVETITIFYGFAKNIYLEYRTRRRKEVEFNPTLDYGRASSNNHFSLDDVRHRCLEKCLKALPPTDSDLIIQYYSEDKIAKIKLRQKLADELDLKAGTLHTKTHRIRLNLKKCIHKCLSENNR